MSNYSKENENELEVDYSKYNEDSIPIPEPVS